MKIKSNQICMGRDFKNHSLNSTGNLICTRIELIQLFLHFSIYWKRISPISSQIFVLWGENMFQFVNPWILWCNKVIYYDRIKRKMFYSMPWFFTLLLIALNSQPKAQRYTILFLFSKKMIILAILFKKCIYNKIRILFWCSCFSLI